MAECQVRSFAATFVSFLEQTARATYSRVPLSADGGNQKITFVAGEDEEGSALKKLEICAGALQELHEYLWEGRAPQTDEGGFLVKRLGNESFEAKKRILSAIEKILPCYRVGSRLLSLSIEEAARPFFSDMQSNPLGEIFSCFKEFSMKDSFVLDWLGNVEDVLSILQTSVSRLPEVKRLRSVILSFHPSLVQEVAHAIEAWVGPLPNMQWRHETQTFFYPIDPVAVQCRVRSSWSEERGFSWNLTTCINEEGELCCMELAPPIHPIKLPPGSAVSGENLRALLTGRKVFSRAEIASFAFRCPDMDTIVDSFLGKKGQTFTLLNPEGGGPRQKIDDLLRAFHAPEYLKDREQLKVWIKGEDPLARRLQGIFVAASPAFLHTCTSFTTPKKTEVIISPGPGADNVTSIVEGKAGSKRKVWVIKTALNTEGKPIKISLSPHKQKFKTTTPVQTIEDTWAYECTAAEEKECKIDASFIPLTPLVGRELLPGKELKPEERIFFNHSPTVPESINRSLAVLQRPEIISPMGGYLASFYGGKWIHHIMGGEVTVKPAQVSIFRGINSTLFDTCLDHYERAYPQKRPQIGWNLLVELQDDGTFLSAKSSPSFVNEVYRLPHLPICPTDFTAEWMFSPARSIASEFARPNMYEVFKADFNRIIKKLEIKGTQGSEKDAQEAQKLAEGSSTAPSEEDFYRVFDILCEKIGGVDEETRTKLKEDPLAWITSTHHPKMQFFSNLGLAAAQVVLGVSSIAINACESFLPAEKGMKWRFLEGPLSIELGDDFYLMTRKVKVLKVIELPPDDPKVGPDYIDLETEFTFKRDRLCHIGTNLTALQCQGVKKEAVDHIKQSLSGFWLKSADGEEPQRTVMPVLSHALGFTGMYVDLLNEQLEQPGDISPIIQKIMHLVVDRSYLKNLIDDVIERIKKDDGSVYRPYIYSSIVQEADGFAIQHAVVVEQVEERFEATTTVNHTTRAIFNVVIFCDKAGERVRTEIFSHPKYQHLLPRNIHSFIWEFEGKLKDAESNGSV